jgi:hypothetical protein
MVAGRKDGRVSLYRNSGDQHLNHWQMMPGYFDGITVGAFSSPAVGDIDGDGKLELVVGTGGFSPDSGKLLFFRNEGTTVSPRWTRINAPDIRVGNDAAVTIVDFNFDGKPDIIVGNSEGKLFFYRNESTLTDIKFTQDLSLFQKRSFGMYAVPAAVKVHDRVLLMVGNSMGKLYLFELKKNNSNVAITEKKMKPFTKAFASPAFADLVEKNRFDLVLSDGDGTMVYLENMRNDFTVWEKNERIFANRIHTGPACAPTISTLRGRTVMVIGNIDGTLRLFELEENPRGLPWIEMKDYLKGIKVTGFSRGMFKTWNGKDILITGQSNGGIRAFINMGSSSMPLWKEDKKFFQGIQIKEHSTPVVFDMNDNGEWLLISGAADGRIYAYQVKGVKNGVPEWERIRGAFDHIRVDSFSVPSLARDGTVLYLFVGQQDGRIRTYTAEIRKIQGKYHFDQHTVRFQETDYLRDIRMGNHSSPFVVVRNGVIELIAGDYDGNMRHFICSNIGHVALKGAE